MNRQPDFEALFDASPYPYLLIAPDFRLIGANPAYLKATGRTAQDLLGRHIFEAFPANPADPDSTNLKEVSRSIELAFSTGKPHTSALLRYAVPRETPQGTVFDERYWSAIHTPVFDKSGQVAFVSQNAIDVSDLYQFDPASSHYVLRQELNTVPDIRHQNPPQMHQAMTRILHAERNQLQLLFNQAPGFIAVLMGKSLVFEMVNEAYYQLVGHRPLIGKALWDALPELAGQGFEELLGQVFESGKPVVLRNQELLVQRQASGPMTQCHVELVYQPMVDADGQVIGIFAQGHDVTEAYVATQRLQEKVQQLQQAKSRQEFQLCIADLLRRCSDASQVLATSSQLIARHFGASQVLYGDYDAEQRRVTFHANPTDRSVGELSGTLPVSLFGAENFRSIEQGVTWVNHDVQTDARTSNPEILRKFQEFGVASGVVVPLNRNKAIVPCLFVNANAPRQWTDDDVSLIEDAAERIWNAVERIRAEEALKQADRRKDDFLAMLAHELRNPLAPIGAAAHLLQFARLDETRLLQTSQVIERQVRHMTSLVDDLLDVSRVTRGLVKLDSAALDIRQIVTDAVEQVTPLLQSKEHHLSMKLSPGSARVMGDKKRLVQIIANLLNNAAKYTHDGGKILLSVDVDAKRVQLHVSDNGVGMTAELVAHVFDLFAQAERSSDRSAGGLGLGLALVKSLVELHGGTVACYSDGPGKGSRFTICLPRLLEEQETPEVLRPDSTLPPTAGGLRILVVDDNEDAAAVLSMLLEMSGHHVMVEHSSHKALERARISKPDVCLLDIGLPEINGNELARLLLAQSGGQAMTLVAVTGYGQESDRELTRAAGFAHHLVKPVDIPKLFSILAEANKSWR